VGLANGTESQERTDVCVIGHVCRDTIRIGNRTRAQVGGTAYYCALALCRLGRRVAVVTKLAAADRPELLRELRSADVTVSDFESPRTTHFENLYPEGNPDSRSQRVSDVASPFEESDLGELRARVFHLGPLTNRDMDVEFLRAVSTRGEVSLDVQGLLRRVEAGAVLPENWAEREAGLACVDIVKADRGEARLLSGESDPERAARRLASFGPREVIVTLGGEGSLVLCEGHLWHIPAFPAAEVVDPTGCGDSYMAAYLDRRLAGEDPERAGAFAAAVGAVTLQSIGPFRGSVADVERLLTRNA
jgi:sugar/nucleoside kinase (ribokinase family)